MKQFYKFSSFGQENREKFLNKLFVSVIQKINKVESFSQVKHAES
jgi:hypothetical protein